METLILTCTIISSVFSILALCLGGFSVIMVIGLRNSTHRIEWKAVPTDPFKNDPEDEEEFNEDPTKDL